MADQKDTPPGTLEEQLKEMLRKGGFSFFMQEEAQPAADAEEEQPEAPAEPPKNPLDTIRHFELKPHDVRNYLDRFVIRQDEAKKVLSVAICDHFNHVRACLERPELQDEEYTKHNMLLLGPTGVGKTYLMRCAARLIGVPFVKADATKFSETGYVGHDVEDLVRDLVKAADGNLELAQYGIVFVDEIDKIASTPGNQNKDVSGRGVQTNLLKLLEETDVGLFSQTDLIGQMQAVMQLQKGGNAPPRTISTRHILFIVSGAFDGLQAIIERRINSHAIGFSSTTADTVEDDDERLAKVSTADLVQYGFEPEFVGRLPVRVVCRHLGVDDLKAVLASSEGSVLRQYKRDFEGYGIALETTPDALHEIALRAHREKTGARGLMTVLERVCRDLKFEMPSTPHVKLTLDAQTICDPEATLQRLLAAEPMAAAPLIDDAIDAFCAAFLQSHGLQLQVPANARAILAELCANQQEPPAAFLAAHFHDMEHGLALISRHKGQTRFRITQPFARDPQQELSRRVAKSCK